MKARRERDYEAKRERPLHMFYDIGPPCGDADYQPRGVADPERHMALIFARLGRDYGGALTPPAAHSSIEATAEAE